MKKIGILTHYNVNNQGAQLQMYATYNQIKKYGMDPYVLTYNKNFDFVNNDDKKKNIVGLSSIPFFIKEFLLKKGIKLTWFNVRKFMKNRKFRNTEFVFKDYAKFNTDYAIVGADEVFSVETGINIMMFGHAVATENMVCYAPSCGQTNKQIYIKHNCYELVKAGLGKFKSLAARDENTKNMIIEATGNTEIPIVLDPVLLYDFSDVKPKVKIPKKKYMIVYAYDKNMNNEDEVKAIKKYAKDNELITVSVGTYHKWCDKNISCDCLEWIEYFRNAECVITDTFHGTILSIITNRELAVIVRKKLNSNKLTYLLKQLGVEDRRLNNCKIENIKKMFDKKVDYKKVNECLEKYRKESDEYLRKALGVKNG